MMTESIESRNWIAALRTRVLSGKSRFVNKVFGCACFEIFSDKSTH